MGATALIKLVELRRMQAQHSIGKISWCYFFYQESRDLYKIGKSNNPWRRCQELSSIMGEGLYHVWSFKAADCTEKVLHRILQEHSHSHEWFLGADEIAQLIECFQEFDLDSGLDNPVLSADDVETVIDDWQNSYGRGRSAHVDNPCGNRGNNDQAR